jgi:hypothetical protein
MYLSVGFATARARKSTAAKGLADRRRAGGPGESSLVRRRTNPRRPNVVSPERGVPPHVARWFVAHARSGAERARLPRFSDRNVLPTLRQYFNVS